MKWSQRISQKKTPQLFTPSLTIQSSALFATVETKHQDILETMKFLLTTAILSIIGLVDARLGEVVDERSLEHGDDYIDVLIGYKSGFLARRNSIQARSNRIYSQFPRLNTLAARMPKSQLLSLADDADIDFVEEDYRLFKNGETVPYGIEQSQGLSDVIPRSFESTACNDPNSFKIGIIDSGISISHPDTPCGPSGNPTNCKGITFGLSTGVEWYNPTDPHGTHIAGTIGAIGKNNLGVAGMLQDDNVCYLIARVFGDDDKSTSTSSVVSAVEWLEDQGAKVISMSLGGSSRSQLLGNAIAEASANGVLVIASSGNDGSTALNYPASFPDVISVAAVDSANQLADFSQSNSEVDISAPGVDILSTVPLGSGTVGNVDLGDFAVSGKYLKYSVLPGTEGIKGKLVECPDLGRFTCPGPGGHICLIKR
jgi:serine protease